MALNAQKRATDWKKRKHLSATPVIKGEGNGGALSVLLEPVIRAIDRAPDRGKVTQTLENALKMLETQLNSMIIMPISSLKMLF